MKEINLMALFKKKSKQLNWMIILFVIVLSYGFVLTNQSIGVDDENFDFYYKYDGLVASGRWGSWFIGKFINTYSYLPVWRDTISIAVLLVAAIIFVCCIEKVYGKELDKTIVNIIVSMIISYPLIAKKFVYIDTSLDTSLCILFATVSSYILINHKGIKANWQRYLLAYFLLTLGYSLLENTLVIFCIEICFFSLLQDGGDNIWQDIIIPIILCVVSALSSKEIGILVSKSLGIDYLDYGMSVYFKWGKYGIHTVLLMIKDYFIYWVGTCFSVMELFVSLIFWFLTSIVLFMRKKITKALYSLGIIVSSFTMYIVTGDGSLPIRIFIFYFIPIVGCVMFVWIQIEKKEFSNKVKKLIEIILVCCCSLCIFYQTKEINEFYQMDYKRFLIDQDIARNVNYDLSKLVGVTPQKPVIFLGQPGGYCEFSDSDEIAFTSIYFKKAQSQILWDLGFLS